MVGAEATIYAIFGATSSGLLGIIFNAALEWNEKTVFDLK